jgi:hypothetical protein
MRRVRTRGGARRVGHAGGHAIRGHARRRDPPRQGAVAARASGAADACCSRRRTRAALPRGGCARRSGSDQDTRAARCRPSAPRALLPVAPRSAPDHPDPFRAEHLIEGSRELAVAVANQEARPLLLVGDRHSRVSAQARCRGGGAGSRRCSPPAGSRARPARHGSACIPSSGSPPPAAGSAVASVRAAAGWRATFALSPRSVFAALGPSHEGERLPESALLRFWPMGRGSLSKRRWRNDRKRRKLARERRRQEQQGALQPRRR